MALDMGGIAEMAGMEGVSGMGATTAEDVLRIRPWSLRDFGLMSAMWVIMMVGMMVPTAVPMVLIFAAISRKAAGQGQHVAHTGFFVTGYIGAWTGFSLLATVAQWGRGLPVGSPRDSVHVPDPACLAGRGLENEVPS